MCRLTNNEKVVKAIWQKRRIAADADITGQQSFFVAPQ